MENDQRTTPSRNLHWTPKINPKHFSNLLAYGREISSHVRTKEKDPTRKITATSLPNTATTGRFFLLRKSTIAAARY
jgi:hypothetical protein